MEMTLKGLHEQLNVKQNLAIYVRNTNKKYKSNYTEDTILSREMYMLIKFNTLGKLRHHGAQMKLMNNYVKLEDSVRGLESQQDRMEGRAKLASELIEKDNLKNSYIETLKMANVFRSNIKPPEEVYDFLEKNGVRYAKFVITSGIEAFFNDRIEWFESELAKMK